MAAGAAITVTTKSGTNNFRGSAFEFFNNEKLNANPYYFGRGAVPAKLPVERQTFGGTLGGPIVKNQLFFFGSYEGYLQRARTGTLFPSVPDAALRNGDFSGALNTNGTLQRIYDPFTGDMATGTRPRAVREQRHSRRAGSTRSRRSCSGVLSAAERRGHGRRRPDQQLSRDPAAATTAGTTSTSRSTGTGRRRTSSGAKVSHMNAVVDDLFTSSDRPNVGRRRRRDERSSVTAARPGRSGPTLPSTARSASRQSIRSCSSPDFLPGQ